MAASRSTVVSFPSPRLLTSYCVVVFTLALLATVGSEATNSGSGAGTGDEGKSTCMHASARAGDLRT